MTTKIDRAARWARRKAKHRADHNHSKRGGMGGNPRHNGKNGWWRPAEGDRAKLRTTDRRIAA